MDLLAKSIGQTSFGTNVYYNLDLSYAYLSLPITTPLDSNIQIPDPNL